MHGISKDLQDYIEGEILPRYSESAGHTAKHIEQVIRRSLKFIDELNDPKPSRDMAYVIAAYHDLGREIDDDTHEKISAQMLLADENLRKFFSEEELKTMAEAVEDHRASNKNTPRSIYGKIVSSADRNTRPEDMLTRCFYFIHDRKKGTIEEDLEETRLTLRRKYGGKDGYAAKKMYFPDAEFEACLVKMEEITRDKESFLKEAKRVGIS